jgi:vitamin B12 transporter
MRFLLLSAALVAAVPVAAQPVRQPEVVVTATRRAQTVDDTLATVTVITREDIARSHAPDLLTLLRRVPGVDVARTGGEGQQTSLFLRGSNSNQALVLIDGIRAASANTGGFAWEHLPLGQVERIEIVRGPRAAWHGSDAIGGVVQVFTREAQGAAARLALGRWERSEAQALYGVGDASAGFGVVLGATDFEGFSARLPGTFGFDPDADGYRNRNLGLRGNAMVGAQRLALRTYSTRADVEFDQGDTAVDTDIGGLSLEGPLGTSFGHRLVLGFHREALDTPVFAAGFRSRRSSLDWTGDLALDAQSSLVFGLNWQRERGESLDTSAGSACVYCESRRNLGLFASAQGSRGAFDWQAAARHDDNSSFDGASTGQIAGGWRAGESLRLFASFGQGFRAPNLNELYSPGFGGLFAGNPDLGPERSRSAEFGIDAHAGAHVFTARLFSTRVKDLIAFQGGQTFRAVNVARAAIDGAELRWTWQGGAWRLDADASWQDARDATSDLALLRRPERKFGVAVERSLGALTLGVDLQQVSSRRDFAATLPSYALLDLRLDWPLAGGWRLGARLDNALDREYALASGFATPRRALLLDIAWQATP